MSPVLTLADLDALVREMFPGTSYAIACEFWHHDHARVGLSDSSETIEWSLTRFDSITGDLVPTIKGGTPGEVAAKLRVETQTAAEASEALAPADAAKVSP